MKKKLLLGVLLSPIFLFSQIGIKTANPQGIFHVDGAADNSVSGVPSASQQLNDFTITASGNVGIGTTTPSKKLEIVSSGSPALRIADGTERANYILTSDAAGNCSWMPNTTTIMGVFPETGFSGPMSVHNKFTGVTLTLPPGRWMVLTNILLKGSVDPEPGLNKGAWVRLGWSSIPDNFDQVDITTPINSGALFAPFGTVNGITIISNTGTASKTYYLNILNAALYNGYDVNFDNLGKKDWFENSIIAYPAN